MKVSNFVVKVALTITADVVFILAVVIGYLSARAPGRSQNSTDPGNDYNEYRCCTCASFSYTFIGIIYNRHFLIIG